MEVPLNRIVPSPRPIRLTFSKPEMEELAASIREHGLLSPPKLRQVDGQYQIVFGHRRVQACRMAGLKAIEATVEGVEDIEAVLQGLIENLQRQELSDMEEGQAFASLQAATEWTNSKIGEKVGKAESYIATRITYASSKEIASVWNHLEPDELGQDEASKAQRIIAVGNLEGGAPLVKRLAKKVIEEHLSEPQLALVTASVKTALAKGDTQEAEFLVKTPFSPAFHAPAAVTKQSGKKKEHRPSPDAKWLELPSVKELLTFVNRWVKTMPAAIEMVKQKKLSPEGKRFLAQRLRPVSKELAAFIRWLEG